MKNQKLRDFIGDIVKKIIPKIDPFEYQYITSSRTKIRKIGNIWGSESNIWEEIHRELENKVEEGITLYYEIVGFTPSGSAIQGGYDYGCIPYAPDDLNIPHLPQHLFVVYRITKTDSHGNVLEFNWNQVKEYCKKYKLEHVKELFYGKASQLYGNLNNTYKLYPVLDVYPENFSKELFHLLDHMVQILGNCIYCKNPVPAEGVILRQESGQIEWYKLKAKNFLIKESQQLDKEEISIEDQN